MRRRGRDISGGIATRYRLDGPGIESRWGARFSEPVQTDPEGGYRFSFPGVKRPGLGFDHPLPSSAEGKERVELYLYSPSGPSWPILGWTLPVRRIRETAVRNILIKCLAFFLEASLLLFPLHFLCYALPLYLTYLSLRPERTAYCLGLTMWERGTENEMYGL